MDWAALSLAGMRQSGAEWRGPCPVTGEGRDTFWINVERQALGCYRCGLEGGVHGELFKEHAERVGIWTAPREKAPGSSWGRPSTSRTAPASTSTAAPAGPPGSRSPAGVLEPAASERPARVWAAAGAVSGTPGAVYLGARLGEGWLGEHLSVRWIGAAEYSRLDVGGRPGLPAGAAGALVYLFAAPADRGAAHAVQVEAVDVDGQRSVNWRHWDRDTGGEVVRPEKRVSVAGSRMGRGRRVFVARLAAGPCWLVEGPIDALAVARNLPAGLAGAILGAAGVPGFKVGAVEAIPAGTEVVIAADGDPEGRAAAVRLGEALERIGRRPWSIRSPGAGDWCDWFAAAAVDREEREAIRNEW